MTPRKQAQALITKFGTRDPHELADYLHIDVFYLNLGRLKGVVLLDNGFYIGVNNELCNHELRVVLAHELGHALLHSGLNLFFMKEYTLFTPGKFERQANEFAAELLIPDEAIRAGVDKRLLAAELQVPVELFEYKKTPDAMR